MKSEVVVNEIASMNSYVWTCSGKWNKYEQETINGR